MNKLQNQRKQSLKVKKNIFVQVPNIFLKMAKHLKIIKTFWKNTNQPMQNEKKKLMNYLMKLKLLRN